MSTLRQKIEFLYPEKTDEVYRKLRALLDDFKKKGLTKSRQRNLLFSEKDVILICYADHVRKPGVKALKTMSRFLRRYAKPYINKIHFLPFYPYSSDDGFSVIDYYKVKKEFGGWEDIKNINRDFGLMFDLVINHVSAKNQWFKKFLQGEKKYQDFFIAFDKRIDASRVFRPRAHPLLTPFKTRNGKRFVWTTFSEDQPDLNFKNPQVLLEMIKVLLFYVKNGAEVIRLDAIAYLWKELGTSCIHLPQTHVIVKLLRDVLEEVAPYVWIITETNVPHKDNISYFGNGKDEAHLVYNFTLPPLLLYSLLKGEGTFLTEWASTLKALSQKTAFLNFTASHDGIGLTPLRGIIPEGEMDKLVDWVLRNRGRVNYRDVPGQKPQPYELNVVYLSALGSTEAFLASQAIQLSLQGVPAIYFNALVGAENWYEGVEKLGYNRAINRQKFDYKVLSGQLEDKNSTKHKVYRGYINLLKTRISEPLFSPHAEQKILKLNPQTFAALRFNEKGRLLALTNISSQNVEIKTSMVIKVLGKRSAEDLLSRKKIGLKEMDVLFLKPYQVLWLK